MTENQPAQKSSNVTHSPAIIEYSERHSKEPHNLTVSASFARSFTGFMFLCFVYTAGQCVYRLNPILDLGNSVISTDKIAMIFYYLFSFSFIFSIQNFILSSLKSFGIFYKLSFPDFIFVPSFLKNFAKSIAVIIAWSFSSYLHSFATFKKCLENDEADGFTFVKHIVGQKAAPNVDIADILGIPLYQRMTTELFESFIPILIKIYVILKLRDFITFTLNYLIHYKYYEKRIIENTGKITILRAMNDIVKSGYTVDIEETAERVFKTLSFDGVQPIKQAELKKFFDESVAHKIYELCNGVENDGILEDEICAFYISTLTEQMLIEKSICSNTSTVQSFKSVLDVGVFLLVSVVYMNYFSIFKLSQIECLKGPSYLLAAIFSVNYIFTESFKGFFNSLYFIFFVRPYEIGDLIVLNDKEYEVSQINLLTTILYDGGVYIVFPNPKISSEPIKNLRLNRTWEENFTYMFSYETFESKSVDFLKKLSDVLKKKSSEFRKKPYFKKTTLLAKNMIEVTLTVQINTSTLNIEKIRERKNGLVLKLNSLFNETGMIPFDE